MRIEIFARASGIRTFDDPAMLVMSTPIALIDGLAQSRDATGPEPTTETPSGTSALDRRSSSLNSAPSQVPRGHSGHGDVALVVDERGQQAGQRHHGVRCRPTEQP